MDGNNCKTQIIDKNSKKRFDLAINSWRKRVNKKIKRIRQRKGMWKMWSLLHRKIESVRKKVHATPRIHYRYQGKEFINCSYNKWGKSFIIEI
jgi:hypothetical protein